MQAIFFYKLNTKEYKITKIAKLLNVDSIKNLKEPKEIMFCEILNKKTNKTETKEIKIIIEKGKTNYFIEENTSNTGIYSNWLKIPNQIKNAFIDESKNTYGIEIHKRLTNSKETKSILKELEK